MDVISIIVPVYNIKSSMLDKCIDSLLQQTYKSFELIIVDDGSTKQETIECLKDCSLRDNRIKLLTQKNQGVSVARNHGFENSNGQYIAYIDPDDWVDENYLADLYSAISLNDSDIAMCDAICAYADKCYQNRFLLGEERELVGEPKNAILYQCFNKKICGYYPPEIAVGVVWGKLFKRSFIETYHLRFVDGMVRMQDNIFCLYAFEQAKSIHYLPKYLYYYRKENGSACFSYSPNIILYFEQYFQETQNFLDKFHGREEILYEALRMKELTSFNSFFIRYFFNEQYKKSRKMRNLEIVETLQREPYLSAISHINYKLLNTQEKVFCWLLKHHFFFILKILVDKKNKV